MERHHRGLVGCVLLLLLGTSPLLAQEEESVARGRALAETSCGRCHATGPTGPSLLAEAPPFRELKGRYPIDTLAEALAEGIGTGHPQMPELTFEPSEIDDLLAYLRAL